MGGRKTWACLAITTVTQAVVVTVVVAGGGLAELNLKPVTR